MKNVRMLLLPVAMVAGSLCAENTSLLVDKDRQERVERIAKALHHGARHCEKPGIIDFVEEEIQEFGNDITPSEILLAFDYPIDGKNAFSHAWSKRCKLCFE